jgi:hypothetical protein
MGGAWSTWLRRQLFEGIVEAANKELGSPAAAGNKHCDLQPQPRRGSGGSRRQSQRTAVKPFNSQQL